MMSLQPFVDNNKARMNQFLNALCEVPDFYDSLEVSSAACPSVRGVIWTDPDPIHARQTDQYIALSKKDLQISITLNELYNTQSLLEQHIDVLVSSCSWVVSRCARS